MRLAKCPDRKGTYYLLDSGNVVVVARYAIYPVDSPADESERLLKLAEEHSADEDRLFRFTFAASRLAWAADVPRIGD